VRHGARVLAPINQGEEMGRTFQDRDFLVWEVYPSGGRHGFSDRPHIVFNCLTQPAMRPRHVELGMDEADAQRLITEATPQALLELLDRSTDIA
jgi:hypothetical protein